MEFPHKDSDDEAVRSRTERACLVSTPGAVLLVLGSLGRKYGSIYARVVEIAKEGQLTNISGFEDPMCSNPDSERLVP